RRGGAPPGRGGGGKWVFREGFSTPGGPPHTPGGARPPPRGPPAPGEKPPRRGGGEGGGNPPPPRSLPPRERFGERGQDERRGVGRHATPCIRFLQGPSSPRSVPGDFVPVP